VKKQKPIPRQIFDGDLDDVTCAREPGMSVPDARLGLKAMLPKPSVGSERSSMTSTWFPRV